jgi:microcompartment protein CcmK/EutM
MQDIIVARILTKLQVELLNLEDAVKKQDTKKMEEVITGKEELLKQLKLLMVEKISNKRNENKAAIERLSDLLSKQILIFNELKAKYATEEQLIKSSQMIDLLLEEIRSKQQSVE